MANRGLSEIGLPGISLLVPDCMKDCLSLPCHIIVRYSGLHVQIEGPSLQDGLHYMTLQAQPRQSGPVVPHYVSDYFISGDAQYAVPYSFPEDGNPQDCYYLHTDQEIDRLHNQLHGHAKHFDIVKVPYKIESNTSEDETPSDCLFCLEPLSDVVEAHNRLHNGTCTRADAKKLSRTQYYHSRDWEFELAKKGEGSVRLTFMYAADVWGDFRRK